MTRATPARYLALLLAMALVTACRPTPAAGSQCDDTGTRAAYLYLDSPQCEIPLPGVPFEEIVVWLASTPASKVRFSIPDPPIGTIIGATWNYPQTGDRTGGLELDLGDCSPTGAIALGTLLVTDLPQTLAQCVRWRIDDGAEVDYCTGETRTITPWFQHFASNEICDCASWQWCLALPPHDLSPPDGAVDVPVDAVPSCYPGCELWISTDPTCATGQTFPCGELPPGFLQHGTTYYWRVSCDTTGDGCSNAGGVFTSPIHSFATKAAVAAETTTWGAVKALYD